MTRRPLEVRIRARNPEVLLRLRLVPPNVRLVILSFSQASQTRFEKIHSLQLYHPLSKPVRGEIVSAQAILAIA